jgi:hypothetical protein
VSITGTLTVEQRTAARVPDAVAAGTVIRDKVRRKINTPV